MSKINIVLGSHGSGKSTYLYDRIFDIAYNDGKLDLTKKIFLIVPDQDNFMKQKEIINYSKNIGKGILNIDCISFDRLSYMVFEKTGEKYKYANDDLKVLIIRLAVNELKKENIKFKYFDFTHDNIGVYSKIKSALSEFSNYGINDKALDNLWNNIKDNKEINLREKNKIEDLKIIQKKYYEILDRNGYKINEEKLSLLSEDKLKLIFENSYCFFDGFTGFTPLQKDVFKNMLNNIKEAYISIDIRLNDNIKNAIEKYSGDGFIIDDAEIFNLSVDYIKTIEKIRQDLNIKEKLNFIYPVKNKNGECIKYKDDDFILLERNIFSENKIEKKDISLENIIIFKGLDVKNEIEQVANEIIKITRNSEDITYDDIKIVTPDINVYKNTIMDMFKKKNIPFFIDDSSDILDSPLISSVKNLLFALKNNFLNDSIMKYIKSGLYNFDDDLFYLDNLAKEYNLYNLETFENRLKAYKEIGNNEYNRKNNRIDNIIKLEEEIIHPLKVAKEKFINSENNINTYIDIIKTYLKDDSIINRYKDFIVSMNENDSIDLITQKMLTDNMSILCDICDTLSFVNDDDQKITIDVFIDLFNLCIESIKYKTIPMQLNQIVVGDLVRSRYTNPKIVFFIGMNESLLPPEADDTNLINDEVKKIFEDEKYQLSFNNFMNTINSKFYTYLAVTSPINKLYLSYSEINMEGYIDYKSFYLNEIENIFRKDKKEKVEKTLEQKEKILYSESEVNEYIRINNNDNLGKNDKEKIDILSKYVDKDKFSDINMDSIKENTVDVLFDDKKDKENNLITISTTGVEAYASCPFKYFSEKLLHIYEREEFNIESNLLGNVNHNIMQKIDEIRMGDNDKEVSDLLSVLDQNKYVDESFLKKYFSELKDNKYKIDEKLFLNILSTINEDCKNIKYSMEYSTIKYDIDKKIVSLISIDALIKDIDKLIKHINNKQLLDDCAYILSNSSDFYKNINIFKKSYIKDELIKKISFDIEKNKDNGIDSDVCDILLKNILIVFDIFDDFNNLYSDIIAGKRNNKICSETFIKYCDVGFDIDKFANSFNLSLLDFLDYIKNILMSIKEIKNLKVNDSIYKIVDKLISDKFIIKDYTNLKDINVIDFKNDRKFKDSKLGEFLLYRIKEVLSKTLYNLVINDIYRMDSILSKVEYDINKYEISYDNEKGEGENLNLKVLLNGRVDKFIVGATNNDIYIEIVDYKSSNKTVSLNDIKSGKDLRYIQTLIYLSYLLNDENLKKTIIEKNIQGIDENSKVLPIGSFYQGVIDEYSENENDKSEIKSDYNLDLYKMTGVLNKDAINVFEKGLEYTNDNLTNFNTKIYKEGDKKANNVVTKDELEESIILLKNQVIKKVNEINHGNIAPKPYNGGYSSICSYCNLKSFCKREEKFVVEDDDNE